MPEAPREFDVRKVPPAERQARILNTFDALRADESIILVDDRDPKSLLSRFHDEHPGLFEWNVLEGGPERFRIEIRRRPDAGPRTVGDYLGGDHRRLEAILGDVESQVGVGSFPAAERRFAEFVCGLDRHIDMEERILFPVFEQTTGMTGGPTVVMRHEHVEIRGLMQEGAAALARRDAAGFTGAASGLREVVGEHNLKEERILYPMCDEAAGSDRERDALVRRMLAL